MDNELVEHKSWMKQNRKWFFPLIVVLVITLGVLFSSGISGKVADIGKAYGDPILYERAILEVKKNEDAINALGEIEPIDKMAITEGFVNYSEDNKAVKTTIRIKGSQGQGKLDILAEKEQNHWRYKEIKVRVRGLEEPIMIVKK